MKFDPELLIQLLELRHSNFDMFMDKLYEATTGEGIDIVKELLEDDEHKNAIEAMIYHYELKEEYEKCQRLMDLLSKI
jgi:hypothetical protein